MEAGFSVKFIIYTLRRIVRVELSRRIIRAELSCAELSAPNCPAPNCPGTGRKGRMRRATFDDVDAIMDINDNTYDGLDYMPTLFYIMHSKLHVIYVYDGRLVSLTSFIN